MRSVFQWYRELQWHGVFVEDGETLVAIRRNTRLLTGSMESIQSIMKCSYELEEMLSIHKNVLEYVPSNKSWKSCMKGIV